jgi:hypothetical protein
MRNCIAWPQRRIDVDQSWSGIPYIADGSATIYSFAIRHHSYGPDGTLEVETISCGGTTPTICGQGIAAIPIFGIPGLPAEAYVQFGTNQIWGLSSMPTETVSMSLPMAWSGEAFLTPRRASVVGMHLNEPLLAWPAADQNVGTVASPGTNGSYWVNHDGDSHPGVSVYVVPPGGLVDNDVIPDAVLDYPANASECTGNLPYAWAPAFECGTSCYYARVKRFNTASRVISELNGTLQSCDMITGDVTGPVDGEMRNDLRLEGCTRCTGSTSSASCTDANCGQAIVDFFDDAEQQQQVDDASFHIERIDLSAAANDVEACEIVRDQLCFAPGACN